jgi:hypothetical protein
LFSPARKMKWAREIAGLIHELHRIRIPLIGRVLLPLNTKVLASLLVDIHSVLAAHDVMFWLRDGTSLGIYRDGGFIPWDDDVDLGMWADDLPKAEAALADLAQRGFMVYRRESNLLCLLKDWETVEIVISGVERSNEYVAVQETFFRNLEKVRFLDRDFNIPGPIERYLEFCYGSDWGTPKPDAWWANSCWLPATSRQSHTDAFLKKYPRTRGTHQS